MRNIYCIVIITIMLLAGCTTESTFNRTTTFKREPLPLDCNRNFGEMLWRKNTDFRFPLWWKDIDQFNKIVASNCIFVDYSLFSSNSERSWKILEIPPNCNLRDALKAAELLDWPRQICIIKKNSIFQLKPQNEITNAVMETKIEPGDIIIAQVND